MRKILIMAITLSSLYVNGQHFSTLSPEDVTNLGPVQNLQDYGFNSQATADFYSGFRYRWGGMGLIYGSHIVSPVVYMYDHAGYGSNSFTVGKLAYNSANVLPTSQIKPLFVIKSSGNVGIGNVDPDYKLSIVGSAAIGINELNDEQYGSLIIRKVTAPENYASFGFNNGSLASDNELNSLVITRRGRIGIGTQNPAYDLDVNGAVEATQYYVNGQAINFDNAMTSVWGKSGANANYVGGNVGIGTATPGYQLDVSGTLNASEIRVNGQVLDLASANLWSATGNDIQYNTGGKVGINTTNLVGPYSLFVKDGIITEKVVVEVEGEWPDYVFHPAYKLPSLTEVANYIQEYQHLPEIPSAAEIAKEGLNLGKMEALMMKKIEELTLYAIEQERNVEKMERENETLKEKNEKLEVRNERLEARVGQIESEKDSEIEKLEVRMGKIERKKNDLEQKNQALAKRLEKLEDMMKTLMNK